MALLLPNAPTYLYVLFVLEALEFYGREVVIILSTGLPRLRVSLREVIYRLILSSS